MKKDPLYLRPKLLLSIIAVLLVVLTVLIFLYTSKLEEEKNQAPQTSNVTEDSLEQSPVLQILERIRSGEVDKMFGRLPDTGSETTYTCNACVADTNTGSSPSTNSQSGSSTKPTATPSTDVVSFEYQVTEDEEDGTILKFVHTPNDSVLQVGKEYTFDILVDPKPSISEINIFGVQVSFKFDPKIANVSAGFQKDESPFENWSYTGMAPTNYNGYFEDPVFVKKDAFGDGKGGLPGMFVKSNSIVTSFTLTPLKAGEINLEFSKKYVVDPPTGTDRKILMSRLIIAGYQNKEFAKLGLPVNYENAKLTAK